MILVRCQFNKLDLRNSQSYGRTAYLHLSKQRFITNTTSRISAYVALATLRTQPQNIIVETSARSAGSPELPTCNQATRHSRADLHKTEWLLVQSHGRGRGETGRVRRGYDRAHIIPDSRHRVKPTGELYNTWRTLQSAETLYQPRGETSCSRA